MDKRERFIEIDTELKALSQRRRELLEERRQLSGIRARTTIAHAWVEPIFAIIENHPGISRHEIVIKFGNPSMTVQDLTNCLTTRDDVAGSRIMGPGSTPHGIHGEGSLKHVGTQEKVVQVDARR